MLEDTRLYTKFCYEQLPATAAIENVLLLHVAKDISYVQTKLKRQGSKMLNVAKIRR